MRKSRLVLALAVCLAAAVALARFAGAQAQVSVQQGPVLDAMKVLQNRITDLEMKLAALQQQHAALQKQYASHTHDYVRPHCDLKENLPTLKLLLDDQTQAPGYSVCLVRSTTILSTPTTTSPPK